MLARANLRRRIDETLATASPLALAQALDANTCNRAFEDLRSLVDRSRNRMDGGERAQLDLYVHLTDADDLLGHRFSAFLRANPRAIAALDQDAVEAILSELGAVEQVERVGRRLSARASVLLALLLAVTLLPLAAQYAHQRGLLEGLTEPFIADESAPFVERIPAAQPVRHTISRGSVHGVLRLRPKHVAPRRGKAKQRVMAASLRRYHPSIADASRFGERARLAVRSYLAALSAGNVPGALRHLGLPATSDAAAIPERAIFSPDTSIAIVGSKPQGDGREQVRALIDTRGREYYEVFYVRKDGPAVRIEDRYYVPAGRRAHLVSRLLIQGRH